MSDTREASVTGPNTAARVTALEARVGRLESEREALANLALDWDRDLDRLVDGEEFA